MTPYQAVQFAAAIYDPIAPDIFDHVIRVGSWVVGIAKDAHGDTVIAIAGTENVVDVMSDIDFLLTDAGQLGKVHSGFYRDAPEVFRQIRPYLTGRNVITCHSLGAGHGQMIAGLCAINFMPVKQLFLFESPRAGQEELKLLLRGFVPEIVATKNARDPVPHLPPYFPLLYVDVVDPVDLDSPADSIDPIQDHMLNAITVGVLKCWPAQN